MHFYTSSIPEDAPFVSELNSALREKGHQVTITPRSGEVCGADWMQRIHDSQILLAVLTVASADAEIFRAEWQYALAVKLPVIVLRVGQVSIPEALREAPLIKAAGKNGAEVAQRLLQFMQHSL